MKKYLAIVTVASTLAFSSVPLNAFASSDVNTVLETTENTQYQYQAEDITTTETDTNRISTLIQDNQKYAADFNKITGILTITVTDLKTNAVLSSTVIDTKEELANIEVSSLPVNESGFSVNSPGQIGISPLAVTLLQSEKTFSNYEYFHYSDKTWEIRRPKPKTLDGYYYKNVKESTGSNSTLLPRFKSQVESINTLEFAVISQIGAGAIGIAITAFVPGGAIATGLALTALGYSATSYPSLHSLVNKMEDAYATYMEIN